MAALAALLVGGAAVADDAAQLNALLETMRSYSADFEQVVVGVGGQSLETTTGAVHLARPGRFRWESRPPHPQLLVADGANLYVYDADLEQVTIQAQDEYLNDSPARVLTHGPEALTARFGVAQEAVADGSLAFTLTPKDERSLYQHIRLEFAHGVLVRLDILDHLEQATHITFRNAVLNPALAPATFRFEIPEGVDVIGSTAAAG